MTTPPDIHAPFITNFTNDISNLHAQLSTSDHRANSPTSAFVDTALATSLPSANPVFLHRENATCVNLNTVQPVYRLPTELLRIILLAAFEDDTTQHWRAPRYDQVCRQWKAVAEGMAELWCKINFSIPSPHIPQRVELAETWIERSKNRLMKVCLAFDPTITRFPLPFNSPVLYSVRPVLQMLRKHAERVEALFILDPGTDLCSWLGKSLGEEPAVCFPNATTFRLRASSDSGSHPKAEDTIALTRLFPNLHTVRTPFRYYSDTTAFVQPVWANIRDFKGTLSPGELVNFCETASYIERAEIELHYSSNFTRVPPRNYLPLRHLVTLSINHSDAKANLLPPLPSLRHLIVKDAFQERLQNMIGAWGGNLEYLGIGANPSIAQMERMLQHTPRLQGLRFFSLRGPTTTPPLTFLTMVPALTHLEIYVRATDKAANNVRNTLERCWMPVLPSAGEHKLKSIVFYPTASPASGTQPNAMQLEEVELVWNELCDELADWGVKAVVHGDFLVLQTVRDIVERLTFDTQYFIDRGLARYPYI